MDNPHTFSSSLLTFIQNYPQSKDPQFDGLVNSTCYRGWLGITWQKPVQDFIKLISYVQLNYPHVLAKRQPVDEIENLENTFQLFEENFKKSLKALKSNRTKSTTITNDHYNFKTFTPSTPELSEKSELSLPCSKKLIVGEDYPFYITPRDYRNQQVTKITDNDLQRFKIMFEINGNVKALNRTQYLPSEGKIAFWISSECTGKASLTVQYNSLTIRNGSLTDIEFTPAQVCPPLCTLKLVTAAEDIRQGDPFVVHIRPLDKFKNVTRCNNLVAQLTQSCSNNCAIVTENDGTVSITAVPTEAGEAALYVTESGQMLGTSPLNVTVRPSMSSIHENFFSNNTFIAEKMLNIFMNGDERVEFERDFEQMLKNECRNLTVNIYNKRMKTSPRKFDVVLDVVMVSAAPNLGERGLRDRIIDLRQLTG